MIILAWALVSGCALQPRTAGNAEPAFADGGEPLPAEVQTAFGRAAGGASTRLSSGPWGAGAVLSPEPVYRAASGRDCRRFTVETGGGPRHAGLACRRADGTWTEARLLHRRGRPLTENPT